LKQNVKKISKKKPTILKSIVNKVVSTVINTETHKAQVEQSSIIIDENPTNLNVNPRWLPKTKKRVSKKTKYIDE